jgi:hypothetical protein
MSLGATCAVDFALGVSWENIEALTLLTGMNGWQDVMKMDSLSKRLFIRSEKSKQHIL